MASMRRFALDEWLCAVLLALMTAIAFVNVLGRYLFGYSLAFTEELTLNFFVYVVLLGAGIGYERMVHPRFTTLLDRLPRRLRGGVIVLSYLLGAGLFLVLVWVTALNVYIDVTLFHTHSPALGLPVWVYDAPIGVCVLLALRRMWRGMRRELALLGDGGDGRRRDAGARP